MPLPRISGLLNNCALYSALPEITRAIHVLAERESQGTLHELEGNRIYASYQRLKTLFGQYYGFHEHTNYNWAAFDDFLSQHSFYGQEIIFSPVLRRFIADMGLKDGYDPLNIGLLRDVQAHGAYNFLHYHEAYNLFHNHFGISVQTYEYEHDRATGNAKDNYALISTRITTNAPYPFGETPIIEFYFRGAHFEIQPHEHLAEANRLYVEEINHLPEELKRVHDQISFSQSAYTSNRALGQLFLYVKQCFTHLLNERSKHVSKKHPESMSASEYAAIGHQFHHNTFEGRQTFATILLYMALDADNDYASELLSHMSELTVSETLLASYYLDQLSREIIQSPEALTAAPITLLLEDMALFRKRENDLLSLQQSGHSDAQRLLINSAKITMQESWRAYEKTQDKLYIDIIKQTQALALRPSLDNLEAYTRLHHHASGKGSVGKQVAGVMFMVLGSAMLAFSAIIATSSLGLGLTVGGALAFSGIAALTSGTALIYGAQDKGLYRIMQDTKQEAKTLAPSMALIS